MNTNTRSIVMESCTCEFRVDLVWGFPLYLTTSVHTSVTGALWDIQYIVWFVNSPNYNFVFHHTSFQYHQNFPSDILFMFCLPLFFIHENTLILLILPGRFFYIVHKYILHDLCDLRLWNKIQWVSVTFRVSRLVTIYLSTLVWVRNLQ